MLIAPHPDDDVLAGAGVLQHAVDACAAVRVLYATDGDNSAWAQRVVEGRWRIGPADRARWGARRRGEALAGLELLGVSGGAAAFLGLPDRGLTSQLLHHPASCIASIASEIERFTPTILLCPSSLDLHPDHNALAVVIRFALERALPRMRWPTVLQYLIHGRRVLSSEDPSRRYVVLDRQQVARKLAAVGAHRSQLMLRRRRLFGFAESYEAFTTAGDARMTDDYAVCAAMAEGQNLHFRVPRNWWCGSRASTLCLAIDGPSSVERWCAELPNRADRISLAEVSPGKRAVSAQMHDDGDGRHLRVPPGIFHQRGPPS